MKPIAKTLAALSAFTAPLSATLLLEDSIITGGNPDYDETSPVIGQNPANTGFNGPWLEAYSGAESPDAILTGLSFSDLTNSMTVAGGALDYPGSGNGRTGRLLSDPIDDQCAGSLYFSVLIKLEDLTNSNYRAFELHNNSLGDGDRILQLASGEPGIGTADSNFIIRLFNNSSLAADLGTADTNANLFVGKFTLGTGNNEDTLKIWRNPDLAAEPATGDAEISSFNIQFDRLAIGRFGDSGATFDEIRFGTTWADVTTVASIDGNADGLDDAWATINGITTTGADDDDFDGASNAEEQENGTDPNEGDTDDDGVFDGNETNTGTYNSSTNTGTNPRKQDTDGDTLLDGVETNSMMFVDLNDTGTDPNKSDSDGDGSSDPAEISAGTDPYDAQDSPPTIDANIIGLEVFDYVAGTLNGIDGGEYFDYDNSITNDTFVGHAGTNSASQWTVNFGEPQVACGQLRTLNAGSLRVFNSDQDLARFASGALADYSNNDIYLKVEMTYATGATFAGLSFFHNNQELMFFGASALDQSFGIEVPGGAISLPGAIAQDDTTYCLVVTFEGDTAKLYVDPDLTAAEPATPDIELQLDPTFGDDLSNLYPSAVRLASGGTGTVIWDNLLVTTDWTSLNTTTPTDSDTDNLRDTFERAYTGDLATLTSDTDNDDSDLFNNSQEQTAGTNPLAADTDGDNLDDDAETTTNPCLADSDDDDLNDDVELNLNTDPNDPDSDDDGFNDGLEVLANTDPNDPLDAPTDFVICDGTLDSGYGPAITVQTVQTQFGDNASELNAAYAKIQNGQLFLMLTGNIENNFNKLEIFIDSTNAVTTSTFTSAGNDNAGNMNGLTFDGSFSPDYHLIFRRGLGKADFDIADLGASTFASFLDVFGGSDEGSGNASVATNGTLLTQTIGLAYDNSNTAGIAAGNAAADPAAAQAVTTGLEVCIDLADLGNPTSDIKVMAAVNNSDHNFFSNQILAGLTAPQDNLGGDGAGAFTGTAPIDFTTFAGDQCFTVPIVITPAISITDCSLSGSTFSITAAGLSAGDDYHLEFSSDLATPFVDVASSTFNAAATTDTTTVTVSGTSGFYRVAEGAASTP
ncbi:MAG: hypothetical protein AAGC74_05215 [Verrucomicrobiota bacterium]